jgi:tryptophanyl-tRNA synthetase
MSSGQLERGVAVKAARDGNIEVNVGTWYYPVLMSADILLYDSVIVPVGRDQKQHVEVARDLALKLNHRYGPDTFVVPAASIRDEVAVVPGLDGQKMSKSYGNEIPLWADSKQLRKLVMKITTDSRGVDDVKDPDTCNVFALYKLFATPDQVAALRARYLAPGLGYGHAKQELFEVLDSHLAPMRDVYRHYLEHPDVLEEILADGAARARVAANATLNRLRDRVGLTP